MADPYCTKHLYLTTEDINNYYLREKQSILIVDTPVDSNVKIPYNENSNRTNSMKEIIFAHENEKMNLYRVEKD